jgi:hypothetical protein
VVIYTFPVHLAFNPLFENVRSYFNGYVILFQLPVKDRHGNIIVENMGFYREVIARRISLDLLEEGVLDRAIESTGKLSEMVEAMREAALKGRRMGRDRISMDDLEESLEKLRTTYDMTLTQAHKIKLMEIHNSKEARDKDPQSDLIRELLFSLTAVEYRDRDGRWCSVNPLLIPLVEKWTGSP